MGRQVNRLFPRTTLQDDCQSLRTTARCLCLHPCHNNNIQELYDLAVKLIKSGHAYVCHQVGAQVPFRLYARLRVRVPLKLAHLVSQS